MEVPTTEADDSAVELTFEVRDPNCFFVDLSAEVDCHVRLERFVRRSDDRLLEYLAVSADSTEQVLSAAEESSAVVDARIVGRGDEGLFEFVVPEPCPPTTLADSRAIAEPVTAEDGVGTVVATVPEHVDVRDVVERFRERHSRSSLVARRDTDRAAPVRTRDGARATLTDHLTETQRSVLRTAYANGYFDWPRESTAEDCADVLQIAQPTFSEHVRVAQKKVFSQLFDDSDDS